MLKFDGKHMCIEKGSAQEQREGAEEKAWFADGSDEVKMTYQNSWKVQHNHPSR